MPSRNKKSIVFFVNSSEYGGVNNSRFKYFLIPQSELLREAKKLQPKLEELFEAYGQRQLYDSELLFLIIATVCEERRPHEWWMRGRSEYNFAPRENLFFSSEVKKLGVPFVGSSIADFFKEFRIKNLPVAVPRILCLIHSGDSRLHLREDIITPNEMMEYQSRGERVLTLSRENLLKGKFVDGRRDALEFLLHDIVHANLFFSETYNEQIAFFKALRNVLRENGLQGDSQFVSAIEYIMSDMNSNKAHLQQSLKAAVLEKRRRELSIAKEDKLSLEEEKSLYEQWGQIWL